MRLADFWIWGFAPLQFLLLFTAAFLIGLGVQRVLTRLGWRITTFWQVVLAWGVGYALLAYVVVPPLPFHLFATYMGLITVALFLYAGATESGWQECRDTVLGTLAGRTRARRLARAGVFVLVPALIFTGLHHALTPVFEPPLEFRAYHFAPPATFTVQGATYTDRFSKYWEPPWVAKEETDPSPNLRSAAVTLHIPPDLVELSGGYSEVLIVDPGTDLNGVLLKTEEMLPSLGSRLRAHSGAGPTLSLSNFFIVDRDGGVVGTDTYRVGRRLRCCAANLRTEVPPGSHVYILPEGSPFKKVSS
jgi:hypothetical protein